MKETKTFEGVTPKNIGKLDMVIAFDTTGSMGAYIEDVRQQVSTLIPELFKDNQDLRLGIVAFGDYCDMENSQTFGDAYQCQPLTNNENELVKFVMESRNTSGGDSDEFYELVLKKIIEETEWREDSSRTILLIADANPHEIGYSYKNIIQGNQIDWRAEARKAAELKIKIDTVTINLHTPWYRELSEMTNGISVPFKTSAYTSELLRASVKARGSMEAREEFDEIFECRITDKHVDEEIKNVYRSYKRERDNLDF